MAKDGGAHRVFDKSNDKPLAAVNYLHDLLGTTSARGAKMPGHNNSKLRSSPPQRLPIRGG
jgi:hypothetical protein